MSDTQFQFGSKKDVLGPALARNLANAVRDCKHARAIQMEEGSAYSTGQTFFVGASDAPTCLLEQMALDVWRHHSGTTLKSLSLEIDAAISGVEWWTQVIDARDSIAWHFDRDYQLEEDEGRHVYPALATVTYLAMPGGATVVCNFPGSSSSLDSQIQSQPLEEYVVSKPSVGKHFFFDGAMLHAAPSSLLEDDDHDDKGDEEESVDGEEEEEGEEED